MKRQPESTTEDHEDAGDQEDRGDADDEDVKALRVVNEEPVITVGVDGEKTSVGVTESENAFERFSPGQVRLNRRPR